MGPPPRPQRKGTAAACWNFLVNPPQRKNNNSLFLLEFLNFTCVNDLDENNSQIAGAAFLWLIYFKIIPVTVLPCFAKALAIYRIEKPRNPENRRKIGKIWENPIFCLFLVYFSQFFAYFFSFFLDLGVFLFCRWQQGFCNPCCQRGSAIREIFLRGCEGP